MPRADRTSPFDPSALSSTWGVGLRPHHYPHWHGLAARGEEAPWLEVMADNYLFQSGGPGLHHLDRIASRSRVVLHGVGLDIAGADPLDEDYLRALAALCRRLRPAVVSDHLCFTRARGAQTYDLLPIPYNEALLEHVRRRVDRVQEALGTPLALENVSSYVSYRDSETSEMGFLRELCDRTGCGILLDVNNVFVSAVNHGHDPREEILRVDPRHVLQYHVAGHSEADGFLHDTHDRPVRDEVWDLLALAFAHVGPRPLILENDDDSSGAEDVVSEIRAGVATLAERAEVLGLLDRNGNSPALEGERRAGAISGLPTAVVAPVGSKDVSIAALQEDFVACVQAARPAMESLATREALLSALDPRTAARLEVYRVGYFSRVTANLADTLFEKPAALLSRDVMRGLLGRYFEVWPAREPRLTESCPDLPAFAAALPDVREHPWIPDLLALALARWSVLIGEDPIVPVTSDPSLLRLQRAHAFLESEHPLFSLWRAAESSAASSSDAYGEGGEERREGGDVEIAAEAHAVLVFKSAPTDLEMMHVPADLVGFVRDLSLGKTVLEAIEGIDARGEEPDPGAFSAFLAALSSRAAFHDGSSLPP